MAIHFQCYRIYSPAFISKNCPSDGHPFPTLSLFIREPSSVRSIAPGSTLYSFEYACALWALCVAYAYSSWRLVSSSSLANTTIPHFGLCYPTGRSTFETRIQGLREAHVRDGVALTAFLSWLERAMEAGPEGGGGGVGWPLTEFTVAEKLDCFR